MKPLTESQLLARAIDNIDGTVRSIQHDLSSVRRQLVQLRRLNRKLSINSFLQTPKPRETP